MSPESSTRAERWLKIGVMAGAIVLAGLFCAGDLAYGPELSFGLLYLIPISLVSWFVGRWTGLIMAAASAAAWATADVLPVTYSGPVTPYWVMAWGLMIFVLTALAVSYLKNSQVDLAEQVAEQTAALSEEVAERKQTAQALAHSEEQLRLMIANVKDYAIFMLDADGLIQSWNAGAERLTGYTEAEIRGQPLSRLYPAEDTADDRPRDVIETAAAQGSFDDEGQRVRKDGSRFWGVCVLTALKDSKGGLQGFSVALHDVTRRKQLENEVLETSEGERRRIGRDLHDALGQELTGIAFMTKELEETLQTQKIPESAEAANIVGYINRAIDRTKTLAKGLAPVELDAEGLMAALTDLARNSEDVFKIQCSFRCAQPILIHDGAVAMNLYRIAQEAVSNAVRHGRPRNVTIELHQAGTQDVLTVTDDGIGMPPGIPYSKGMGLRVMAYRARSIGGSLKIQRDPKGGTAVSCSVPHDNQPPERKTHGSA
jgi:two-component system, LuxR family, sensor kinase FixL